jgi:hypothetical protein
MINKEECNVCGMPGIAGMSCSDPDCSGTVEDFGAIKVEAEDEKADGEYDKDLLNAADAEDGTIVSLESLKEEEAEAEEPDHEDL